MEGTLAAREGTLVTCEGTLVASQGTLFTSLTTTTTTGLQKVIKNGCIVHIMFEDFEDA